MPHWRKLGLIFALAKSPGRATTHAQVPTVILLHDAVRVYYAARNEKGQSFPAFFDLDPEELTRITASQERSVLEFGKPGTFDDEGIMPAYAIKRTDGIWMYYSGWNQRISVPYHNSTGLALSTDGGETYVRKFEGPILDRTPEEPYLAVTPSLLWDETEWKVWYISGLGWEMINGKFEPVYAIKFGRSDDGIYWNRPNQLCVEQSHPLEAFSHPSVIKKNGVYHMWYCHRHSRDYRGGAGSYRIGYAVSSDGLYWDRQDEQAGIDMSANGWDSEMQCYPFVIDINSRTYMFYNGNGFGQSGIGLAVLESW